jgi:hypothetical protein
MGASHELPLGPSRDGSVILDIGGETGAVTLVTTPEWIGCEIDLEPCDLDVAPVHSAVRERHGAGGTSYAAVYPRLRAGRYVVEGSGQVVTVVGGRVTDVVFELCHALTTGH